MLESIMASGSGLRNRYHRLSEHEPAMGTSALNGCKLSTDTCVALKPPEQVEIENRLMQQPLAYVALRYVPKTKCFKPELLKAIASYRSAKIVSSCLDGSKPYAEIRVFGRDAYLTVQMDDRNSAADLRLHAKPGGQVAPWQDGWDDVSGSEQFMRHIKNYLLSNGTGPHPTTPLVALSLLSDRLRAAANERPEMKQTLQVFHERNRTAI